MSARVPVTFAPSGVTVWVDEGSTVLEAARTAGVLISAPCGGRGVCGKCAVRVLAGELVAPDAQEARGLKVSPPGVRLSCRARVAGAVTIRPLVSSASQVSHGDEASSADEEFAAAVDLGTSTVTAVIVGIVTGRELGRAVVANRQMTRGADVMSRLSSALGGSTKELQAEAAESVLEALRLACGQAGACLERTIRVTLAGNAVMIALLAGADIGGLATAPFTLPDGIAGPIDLPVLAGELPIARFSAIAPLGAMVGGDVSAGLLAAGIVEADDDCVFVDVGTNAEMVVRRKKRLFYSSAAAGPAFEGWGLASGGPAVEGAVTALTFEGGALSTTVIGDRPPAWLGGSGLVSAVALLLELGHVDPEGAMTEHGPLEDRFDRDPAGVLRVNLADQGSPVYLSQLDVRAFQTAKAAIAAGLLVLMATARLKARHVSRFVVAGAFGGAMRIENLVSTGVVPSDLADRVTVFPDAALLGAASIALAPSLAGELAADVGDADHVELASDHGFRDGFVAATALRPYSVKRGFSV